MAQKTFVAGDPLAAADVNTYLSGEGGAWTSWTPAVTQSGAVTVTVTDAKYARWGRLIHFDAYLIVTGSGTGTNAVTISLPVATNARYSANHTLGTGFIYDTSATLKYKAIIAWATSTTIKLHPTSSTADGYLGAGTFTAGLAVGDLISVQGTYEAAA